MCGICCICSLSPASVDKQCPYLNMEYVESHSFLPGRGPDCKRSLTCTLASSRVQALFAGFVLHLRGTATPQPLTNEAGDVLLWNGEIFGGIEVKADENDTQVLFQQLTRCESRQDFLRSIQSIRGPWSLIFWQAKEERLWFGRDVFGRRSLLWHLPQHDEVFALSSVPIAPLEFTEVPAVGVFCMEWPRQPERGQERGRGPDAQPVDPPGLHLHLHLFPWQGATWPGTEERVLGDGAAVAERLHLHLNDRISVRAHSDRPLSSWMPELNREIPDAGSLLEVDFDDDDDACGGGNGGGGDPLALVTAEVERRGEMSPLVARLQDVLLSAVRKRVVNLPPPPSLTPHGGCCPPRADPRACGGGCERPDARCVCRCRRSLAKLDADPQAPQPFADVSCTPRSADPVCENTSSNCRLVQADQQTAGLEDKSRAETLRSSAFDSDSAETLRSSAFDSDSAETLRSSAFGSDCGEADSKSGQGQRSLGCSYKATGTAVDLGDCSDSKSGTGTAVDLGDCSDSKSGTGTAVDLGACSDSKSGTGTAVDLGDCSDSKSGTGTAVDLGDCSDSKSGTGTAVDLGACSDSKSGTGTGVGLGDCSDSKSGTGTGVGLGDCSDSKSGQGQRSLLCSDKATATAADLGACSLASAKPVRVAVLFSGGVDSTVLAALADRCVPGDEAIDLINVAFEQKAPAPQPSRNRGTQTKPSAMGLGTSHYNVPDRLTGYLALSELSPHRCWNFVEVNVTQEMLQKERGERVRHLVFPLKTVLDDSIGCAVWFAARGCGVLGNGSRKGTPYTSTAKVILCGMGADEQLAGYSRHRVRFQQGSWTGLLAEINMEIHRISARNLGRDDRVIADHGKESRFPFLDEDVVAFLASLPIHHKADLRFQRGVGEKLLLRLLAARLGLRCVSALPKRAIQFGSRIAKLEKSKEKGNQPCQRLMQD